MQDVYKGVPMCPEKMRMLLVELYGGKRFKRSEALDRVKEEYIKRGGVVDEHYNLISCFKKAIKDLKERDLVGHPGKGLWDIYKEPENKEIEVDITRNHSYKELRKLHGGCKQIGKGNSEVYVYYFPAYKELAQLKGKQDFPCKVGMSVIGATGRINTQAGTALPEYPQVDLIIRTDTPALVEKTIHDVLALNGCVINNSPGKEWYLTNPTRIMIVCMRLGIVEGDFSEYEYS